VLILQFEMKSAEIQELMELKNREHFKNIYLNPAIEQDFIELTIPDKPTSPNQKYRLTQKGKQLQLELLKSLK